MTSPPHRADAAEIRTRCRLFRFLIVGFGWTALVGVIVLLRVLWPDSDAYARLSWSSALLTDEGFYLHNARNVVLFGHARTDEFNNMLIMPLLHYVQIGVFRVFGMSLTSARGISVGCSLMTLALFYVALRRVWGRRAAFLGLLLLGLDHANLLYNRLALMDTPAALLLVAGFAAFVEAQPSMRERKLTGDIEYLRIRRHELVPGAVWMLVCGVLFVAAYTVRGLAALVWPAPLVAIFCQYKIRPSADAAGSSRTPSALLLMSASYILGLGIGLGVYAALWWLPHRVELARVNAYYLHEQLEPQTWSQLAMNVRVAALSWARGTLPYLVKHVPVQLGLAIGYGVWTVAGGTERAISRIDPTSALLACWLGVNLLFDSTVNYAPSRYYVIFYPALAGLASRALGSVSAGSSQCLTAWNAAIRRGVRRGAPSAPETGSAAHSVRPYGNRHCVNRGYGNRELALLLALSLWAVVNAGWLIDWMSHVTYRQKDTGVQLARWLPPQAVVFGALAPGLTVDTRLRCVSVIADLCNDDHPLERFAGQPRYILILDDRWKERWWVRHYPELVRSDRRSAAFRGVLRSFFTIGLYRVQN